MPITAIFPTGSCEAKFLTARPPSRLPEPARGGATWRPFGGRRGPDCRGVPGFFFLVALKMLREAAHCGEGKQIDHVDGPFQSAAQSEPHPGHQQRMPAQIEEVIVETDSFNTQSPLPDLSHQFFHLRTRRNIET